MLKVKYCMALLICRPLKVRKRGTEYNDDYPGFGVEGIKYKGGLEQPIYSIHEVQKANTLSIKQQPALMDCTTALPYPISSRA